LIASLSGVLSHKTPPYIIIDVQGVGYRVSTSLSSFCHLPDLNERVILWIHTHVRDDAIQLFGFLTQEEYEVFILLLGVSGIGPRLALTILSGLSVQEIKVSIESGDTNRLSSVPGVGKKTAGRLVLELKEKFRGIVSLTETPSSPVASSDPQERIKNDALTGLVYLGYAKAQGRNVIDQILEGSQSPPTVEQLIRDSLRLLSHV